MTLYGAVAPARAIEILQVAVWEGTVVGVDKVDDFMSWMHYLRKLHKEGKVARKTLGMTEAPSGFPNWVYSYYLGETMTENRRKLQQVRECIRAVFPARVTIEPQGTQGFRVYDNDKLIARTETADGLGFYLEIYGEFIQLSAICRRFKFTHMVSYGS